MKKRISMAKGTQGKAINEGFKEFVTSCKVRNLSVRTIQYYQDCMEIFQEFLDSLGVSVISDITSNTIDNYIIELKSRESMNDVSVNTRVRGVRAIVNYWQRIGYCQSFKITLLKTDKEIKETYTNSELKILLEKPKTNEFTTYRDWVIVNFLLATGLQGSL